MPLEEYKKKRRFDKTPEPTGGEIIDNKLHFVVQKHAASHLHYDFSLELKGVLKSWAVPKGPSLNPDEKRLAMITEDHPYDYKDFEGIIPKGQYGGGTVIIWDEGTYETPQVDKDDKKAQEHSLMGQFFKGGMLFNLHGKKLNGQFALIKDAERDEKSWYLLKVKDKSASKSDVTKKNKSVVSGLTVEEMAENPESKKWQSSRAVKEKTAETKGLDIGILQQGTQAPMPERVEAMNCTLIKEPFNNPDWTYEVKLDGYRIIAIKNNDAVNLFTRARLNYSKYYPAVVEALKSISYDAVVDGELVVLDDKGRPNFDLLQKYREGMAVTYYLFDVLWVDGYDVTGLKLTDRKTLLKQIIPENDVIKYSDDFEDGEALFEQIKAMQLEGIVAKRKDSKYQPGKRVKDWLKLPTEIRQEFVIGGWTESENGRPFRSIVFGAYENGELKFVGHSGSGFQDKVMDEVMDRLQPLEIKKKAFVDEVDHDTPSHWVEPKLVGIFKFATWTASGKIRKPAIFLGFRDDKDPKEVVREVPLSANDEEKIIKEMPEPDLEKEKPTSKTLAKPKIIESAEDSNWPIIENETITSKEIFNIEGKDVTITNIGKQLWSNVTKSELIIYYHNIAPYILPYLKDRPQSLHIKNINAGAPGLYIKDMEGRQPEWADIFSTPRKHKKKGKRSEIDYLVCNNEATLLYMVNLGCVDINPWTSSTNSYQQPDFVIIDLDPSDEDFKKAIETATAAKQFFDANKLKAFPKTSGKTGIHLYVPCEGFSFPEARKIAEHICEEVQLLMPGITTTEVAIAKRGNKLYIDPNQNDEADTVAAPYSVRPFHHPSVSTPLLWKEINDKLDPLKFDINTIFKRLEQKGDLFEKVCDKKDSDRQHQNS
ncbi:DNA ligase D [Segetibacter koreensis]|uniref:DNA ligase D n=1 Tax=Segetibacter koreensis TaxID=398037 RepID=UPI0003604BA7|nr:DNA ligase D [Segetibacter koreensis]